MTDYPHIHTEPLFDGITTTIHQSSEGTRTFSVYDQTPGAVELFMGTSQGADDPGNTASITVSPQQARELADTFRSSEGPDGLPVEITLTSQKPSWQGGELSWTFSADSPGSPVTIATGHEGGDPGPMMTMPASIVVGHILHITDPTQETERSVPDILDEP